MAQSYMELALQEARNAAKRNEVPVGAVLVKDGSVIASDGNRTLEFNDPSAHAEVLVIRQACEKLASQRLPDCDLYVTLEPCTMCAAIISFARIRRLYVGSEDTKGGGVLNGVRFFDQPTCHHKPEVYCGFAELESQQLLRDFFKEKRV